MKLIALLVTLLEANQETKIGLNAQAIETVKKCYASANDVQKYMLQKFISKTE